MQEMLEKSWQSQRRFSLISFLHWVRSTSGSFLVLATFQAASTHPEGGPHEAFEFSFPLPLASMTSTSEPFWAIIRSGSNPSTLWSA